MIHGQPSDWDERIELTFRKKDWTEGCIALENQDMMEVWNLVEDNTVIHIKP
jgi:murein L,D-transpeptidase YafK